MPHCSADVDAIAKAKRQAAAASLSRDQEAQHLRREAALQRQAREASVQAVEELLSSPPASASGPRELGDEFELVASPEPEASPPLDGQPREGGAQRDVNSALAIIVPPSPMGDQLLNLFPISARREAAASLHLIEQFVDARVSFHAESQQTALADTIQLVREVATTQARAHSAQLAAHEALAARQDRQDTLIDLLTRLVVVKEATGTQVAPDTRSATPAAQPAPAPSGAPLPGHQASPPSPPPPTRPAPPSPGGPDGTGVGLPPAPPPSTIHARSQASRSPAAVSASGTPGQAGAHTPPPGLRPSPAPSSALSLAGDTSASTSHSPALSGRVGSLRLAHTGTSQTRLTWSHDDGLSDAAPYGPAWTGPRPVCLGALVQGPGSPPSDLMGGPFAFSFAQAAVQQHATRQRANATPTLIDSIIGAELALNARAEMSYREAYGHPTSFHEVVAEQHLRRDCGLLWVDPTRLVTPSHQPLILSCNPAPGVSCSEVLAHLESGVLEIENKASCYKVISAAAGVTDEPADASATPHAPPVLAEGAPSARFSSASPPAQEPLEGQTQLAPAAGACPPSSDRATTAPNSPPPRGALGSTPKRPLHANAQDSPAKRPAASALPRETVSGTRSSHRKPSKVDATEISADNIIPAAIRPRGTRAASREGGTRDSSPTPSQAGKDP